MHAQTIAPMLPNVSLFMRVCIEAFLAEAKDDFAARVMAFYSNFESRFRGELLRILWKPVLENSRSTLLSQWQEMLGRNTPIDIGSDGGERVPKLTLGDCARLAAREFPELFSGKKENALRELVSMRNKLGHFGTEALAWRDLEVFLRQVKLCSEVMIGMHAIGQTKQKAVHYGH
jgi:hypothetical protein